MSVQLILNIPAADSPEDVPMVFNEAGYQCDIPPMGVMPASKQSGGRNLVHCIVGCTFDEAMAVTSAQRPVWTCFGAISLHEIPNPAHTPDEPPTIEVDGEVVPNPAYIAPTMVQVFEELSPSVWNFLPDRKIYDSEGNEIGSVPVTRLHSFQGAAEWPER